MEVFAFKKLESIYAVKRNTESFIHCCIFHVFTSFSIYMRLSEIKKFSTQVVACSHYWKVITNTQDKYWCAMHTAACYGLSVFMMNLQQECYI